MPWKLKVREYGKIKDAEMEIAPLTLLVGDNNSGKSYLMSLFWGIQNFGITELLRDLSGEVSKAEVVLLDWLDGQMQSAWESGVQEVCLSEISESLQIFLQEGLNRNKNRLLKKIFNSSEVKLKEFAIVLMEMENRYVRFICSKQKGQDENGAILMWRNREESVGKYGLKKVICEIEYLGEEREGLDESLLDIILKIMFSLIMDLPLNHEYSNRMVYLPAARTGFMLTKDIINKVGRNATFNLEMEEEKFSPFTRPINQFLDVMSDLTIEEKGKESVSAIVEYLENGMAEGTVEMSMLPNKEVMYFPARRKKGIPLRLVSAVVTEISPLILMLKHKKALDMLFYEEPEMCLHPQLQQKMAKVICQLVNAGLGMMVTTHSDIILQHINNMISLSEKENTEDICRKLGLISGDLVKCHQVKVYQLKVNSRGKTEVEELICGKNGFAVPTFNDALDNIMDEAYFIQGQD